MTQALVKRPEGRPTKTGDEIKEAYDLATTDRKGPVWVECALDTQSKKV